MRNKMQNHNIPPIFNEKSKIIILGSFPSVISREKEFYYANPKNRFWNVLSAIFNNNNLDSVENKKTFLLENHIALWDVIKSCTAKGSSDSSIKDETANDLTVMLNNSSIKAIFVNGKTAEKFYKKHLENIVLKKAICLPSTSPANAVFSLDNLIDQWKIIKNYL